MQFGLIGLGRMGANVSRRWLRAGHEVVGYARFSSQGEEGFADKVLCAMRFGFRGHHETGP